MCVECGCEVPQTEEEVHDGESVVHPSAEVTGSLKTEYRTPPSRWRSAFSVVGVSRTPFAQPLGGG